jgi:hypothetical protein
LNNNVYPPLRAAAAVAAIYVYLLFYLRAGLVCVCVRVLCRFQTVCRPQFKTNPISRVILFSYCNKEMALFPRMLFGKGHSVFLSLLWELERDIARALFHNTNKIYSRARLMLIQNWLHCCCCCDVPPPVCRLECQTPANITTRERQTHFYRQINSLPLSTDFPIAPGYLIASACAFLECVQCSVVELCGLVKLILLKTISIY